MITMIIQSTIKKLYTDLTDSMDFLGKKSVFSVLIRVPNLLRCVEVTKCVDVFLWV